MNKIVKLSCLALVMGSASLAFAGGRYPQMNPEVRFSQFDKNADGKVTKAEWQAERLSRFDAADSDHNGALTSQEFEKQMQARRANQVTKFFELRDQNHDGKLSQSEAGRMPVQRFAALDKDGDKHISRQELESAPRNPGRDRGPVPPRMLQRLDTNKDGKLQRSEVVANETRFTRLDTNTDGVLTLDEFRSQSPKMGRHGGHGKAKGPAPKKAANSKRGA